MLDAFVANLLHAGAIGLALGLALLLRWLWCDDDAGEDRGED